MNDETTEFFERLRSDLLGSIHSGVMARVQSFQRDPLEATVVPLYSISMGQELREMKPITLPVNVMWAGSCFIIPDYKKDDLVYLVPGMNDFRPAISSGSAITLNESYHALENMVVAFGIKPDSVKIPDSLPAEGVIIGHSSGDVYLCVSSDKVTIKSKEVRVEADSVAVVSDGIEMGGESGLEEATMGQKLKSALESLGDIISGLTTVGGPTNQSADPAVSTAISSWKGTLDTILAKKVKVS